MISSILGRSSLRRTHIEVAAEMNKASACMGNFLNEAITIRVSSEKRVKHPAFISSVNGFAHTEIIDYHERIEDSGSLLTFIKAYAVLIDKMDRRATGASNL